jgi:DNA-binding MarR family transcriptional regulator
LTLFDKIVLTYNKEGESLWLVAKKMRLEDNPILKIHRFVLITDKYMDRELSKRFNISFSQFRVLSVIHFHPGLSQKDIANFQDATQAAISRHIEVLEDKGLVALGTNSSNRKEHNLHLTKLGSEVFVKALKFTNNKLSNFLKKIGKKKAENLSSIFEELTLVVREECGAPDC